MDITNSKEILGGLSNKLYLKDDKLIRIYGNNNVDRTKEIEIMNLISEKNLGPKIIETFEDGRIEEFLVGYRSITINEIRDLNWISSVAKQLNNIHSIDYIINANTNSRPVLIKYINDWTLKARELDSNYDEYYNIKDSIIKKIEQTIEHSKLVLCHNDLTDGNIMVLDAIDNIHNHDIKFIDFEYSGINPFEYDIANFMNELCFHYKDDGSFEYQDRDDWNMLYKLFLSNYGVEDSTINDTIERIKFFRYVSNYLWAIWSIIQHHTSDIEFDYIGHAEKRFLLSTIG